MLDFLDKLARDAKETTESDYYEITAPIRRSDVSLKKAVLKSPHVPVITEIKTASPSKGIIRTDFAPGKIAHEMEKGGALGISVLTEPKNFNGSMNSLAKTRQEVRIPVMMKDIIISSIQLEAASKTGADIVLLICELFSRGYCECEVEEMIAKAHKKNLEVLLETHNEEEFRFAVRSEADLVGINNRNLSTLQVDLNVTKRILSHCKTNRKNIVSESGIESPVDIRFLRESGANAFLVGSAIMLADNVESKVRELVSEF